MSIDLSVVIPSWKDPFLHKTIQSILDNFTTNFEIIPVIDGYQLETPLVNDDRVRPVFLEKNGGMRNAINVGVANARGEYIMRTDEHCMMGPKMDEIVLSDMRDNWIMQPERYFLDPEDWKVMDLPPVQFERLIISSNHNKFSALPWKERDEKLKDVPVAPTMGMQGSLWFMKRDWWKRVIGSLQEQGYGKLYQDSTEMVMKTWQAGGELMLTKKTWFAHKHRNFKRTHHYSNQKARDSWDYARETWEEYYHNVVQPRWQTRQSSTSDMTL